MRLPLLADTAGKLGAASLPTPYCLRKSTGLVRLGSEPGSTVAVATAVGDAMGGTDEGSSWGWVPGKVAAGGVALFVP